MKINKILTLFALSAAVTMFTVSCASTSNKGKTTVNTGVRVIQDFQGSEWPGAQCPKWVRTLNENSTEKVAKELGVDTKDYMIFVAQGRANDLDFAQAWVKNISARQEIAASISQVIATDTQALMEGEEGKEVDSATKKRIYKDATAMASAIELNGLEQVATFWTKTATLVPGKKKITKDSDIAKTEYTYYAVYKMETERFKNQLDAAMKNLNDHTSEQAYLKRVLAAKVGQSIYPGNNVDPEYLK